jgi:hypothetical protein
VGYRVTPRAAIELALGYFTLHEQITRRTNATSESVELSTRHLEDDRRFSAAFAGIGGSLTLLERTPLTVRLTLGAARGRVRASDKGTFSGWTPAPGSHGAPGDCSASTAAAVPDCVAYEGGLTLAEDAQTLFVPFVAPEVRYGLRFGENWSVSAGVTLWAFFAPSERRTGNAFGSARERSGVLVGTNAAGDRLITLPNEDAVGTIFSVSPSIALAWSFAR